MRHWLLSLTVGVLACGLSGADDKNKTADKDKPADKATDKSKATADSPIIKKTREKLETMISVEFTDEELNKVKDELEKLTDIVFRLDQTVPRQKRINFKAKDKPAKDVLDEMLKVDGLGYVIHRKENANDRYEGYVFIVQGDNRGDPTPPKKDKDAKDTKTTKPDPKGSGKAETKSDGDKPTKPPTTEPDNEKLAASKLKLAKQFVEDGQKEDAKEFLETLLKKYPGTKAAEEAKVLLEKLKK